MDYHSVFLNFILTPAASVVLSFICIFLLFISFTIAGAEVAFFSLSFKDINLLKTKQQPSYQRILNLLENPKTLLAGMLITNSLVNIGIILISNTLLNSWLVNVANGWVLFLIKVLVVTAIILLFAEVLPKVWATHHKILFASSSSLLVGIFCKLFSKLSNRLVKWSSGIEKRLTAKNYVSIDQKHIDEAIDMLSENEATPEEKQILKGIRKFSDTTVKQVMKSRLDVHGIAYNMDFTNLLKAIEELHYSRIPIYKNSLDEIAGMLHTKDVLPHLNQPENFDWHSLMRQPFFVHEQKLIEDLLQDFRNKRNHFAIVVDEFGGTSGIVTLEDIMEEITGDIKDEFDDEESGNKKIDNNTYILEGKTMINDVCKLMEIPADTFDKVRGDSDSLAGLVLEIAGEFPLVNEEVISGDFTFIPLEINKNRIDKIKVEIKRTV